MQRASEMSLSMSKRGNRGRAALNLRVLESVYSSDDTSVVKRMWSAFDNADNDASYRKDSRPTSRARYLLIVVLRLAQSFNTNLTNLEQNSTQIEMPQNPPSSRRLRFLNRMSRREMIDPNRKPYNRIIRLEGQIMTITPIQRFLWRYKICKREYTVDTDPVANAIAAEAYTENNGHNPRVTFIEDAATLQELMSKLKLRRTDAFLDAGRMVYFDMIEELVYNFLENGVDLAYNGHNLNSFVLMIRECYLPSLRRQERDEDGLWAKILAFRQLQEILEDEELSPVEAIVKGWNWFVDPRQWPTTSSGRSEYADMWEKLDAQRKQRFLDEFAVDEEKLGAWMSSLSTEAFCCENVAEEEAEGLKRELDAAGIDLLSELNGPKLAEEALEDGSTCTICGEGYSMKGRETDEAYVPVRVTPCGHVFGWRCLMKPMEDHTGDGRCAIWKVRKCACTSPQDFVDGCDRILRWMQPPVRPHNMDGPHSYVNRLMLKFEPADEIRKRLRYWGPHAKGIVAEMSNLGDLGMYQARERLGAILDRDVRRYQETKVKQAHATAQRLWLQFLVSVLPQ